MKRNVLTVLLYLCVAALPSKAQIIADTISCKTITDSIPNEPQFAVGAMRGVFGISPMGAATYSVPIDVPQGVGGLHPQLAVVYNSQAGNGLCGYGANLSGFSSITRAPKDIYHDGQAQGVTYLANDALYLDGVRLVLDQNCTAGQEGAIYYPESDPYTRIIAHGTCSQTANNIWFEVQSSDGMVYWYGKNQDSRLSYTSGSSQRIHSWYICHAQQPTGNYMTYYYQQNGFFLYPFMITYGTNIDQTSTLSNIIEFTYETRADSIPIRFDGKRGCMVRRLKTITGSTNGNTFRSYSLNYNTTGDGTPFKFSRLTSVTESNSQNQQLPPTQLYWSYLPAFNYCSSNLSVQSCFTSFNEQKYSAADLNGDGLSDIIGYSRLNGSDSSSIVINRYLSHIQNDGSISFIPSTKVVFTPSITSGTGFPNNYLNLLNEKDYSENLSFDFDGDGLNEFVIPCRFRTISDPINMTYNEMMGFYMLGADGGIQQSAVLELETTCTPLYTFADIDNDGRTDLIIMETQPMDGYDLYLYKMHIVTYTSSLYNLNATIVDKNMLLRGDPRRMVCADMNGNGLSDIMILYDNSYSILWNQGDGITTSTFCTTLSQSDTYNCYGTNMSNAPTVSYGDFDGDGLLDVITKSNGSNNLVFHLNRGDGSMTNSLAYTLTNPFISEHIVIADFDLDGKTDIIFTGLKHYQYANYYVYTYWLHSDGLSLTAVDGASSLRDEDYDCHRYLTGDFDGDGRVELVNYGYDCVSGMNSNSDPIWRIYKNSSLTVQSGKVTSITSDFGATTGITYSTLTNPSVYTLGNNEPYPAPRYTIPINVVRQTVQDGGATGSHTVNYSYTGLKVHLHGKGLLGFTKTVSNNTSSGVRAESGITQWDTAHYIPKVTYSKTSIGGSVTQSVCTLTIADKGHRRFFAYPSQRVDTDMYGYSITTRSAYDTAHGYPLSDSVIYAAGMYRTTRYQNYTQAGGAYRPQTVVSIQKHPDDASPFSVTTLYSYDGSTGAVLQKVDNSGTSKPLTTRYTYDRWGNITSQVSTGTGIFTPCTTYCSYDATHRFPIRVYTDPASSVVKYTYDIWGNVLTEQDSINAVVCNTVTNTYDAWGNLILRQVPGSGEVTITRGWNSDPAKRWYVLEQGTARPWVRTWYDNNGRQVRTESVGPMGVSVVGYTQFNARGQVTRKVTITGNLSDWTEYEYSSNGTLFREKRPADSYIMHGHWTQNDGTHYEQVNDNGRATNYIYDALGNLKKVEAPVSTVINTFCSCGGIKTIVSGGATWTFQYDDCGNRTSMTDPDAGTTTYVYDALGRETARNDARGVVFVTNYDYLGRAASISATLSGHTETISYNYGTSSTGGTGQMRLVSESLNGITRSYVYDSYGRMTQETMSNETESKVRTYQYGNDGMLSQRTLPGGVSYGYTYDAYGNRTGVNVDGGALSWSLTGYTGRSTTTQTVLDNNASYPFTKTNVLDQYGLPDSIKTSQWGYYYQNDKYVFDPIRGNLTQKSDYSYSSPLCFDYDVADRLTHVTHNNQDIMSITYAQNGNITSKTGIGAYTYGSSSKPHAVTDVDNTDDLIGYNDQDIIYNVWGKVNHVWQEDNTDFYSYSIGYGPDLQRVGSVLYKTYQHQYEKFYWDDYEEKIRGNDTLRYYYVYGADGLVGLLVKQSSPSGMTSHSMVAATDYLGSITALIDNMDICYDARYDVWGDRDAQYVFCDDFGFDRGYTGHEHIDALGLIDMNGRMYDPNLGRFLSPDPFVQTPSNPQNYNRYAYCLNNPLKYTDPSGESVWEAVLIGAAIFGAGNTITHGIRGDINEWKDGLKYFGQGALSGAALGATWCLAPGIPLVGESIQRYMSLSFDLKIGLTTISATNGVLEGLVTKNWSSVLNSAKIFMGNFYIDETASYLEGVWHGYSKHTFESLQTGLGHTYNQLCNSIWRVKSVSYAYGATVAESYFQSVGCITLGSFIHGRLGIEPTPDNEWFQHEYGHYLQSRATGFAYLVAFGLESLVSAVLDDWLDCHRGFYTETNANIRAFSYFKNELDTWVDSDGYTRSDLWKWQVNPLEKERDRNNIFKNRYKF